MTLEMYLYEMLCVLFGIIVGIIIKVNLSPKASILSDNDKLLMLVVSDKYKNSGYKIQLINNKYYVLNYGCVYVDLKCSVYKWPFNHHFYKDCKGSLNDVIKAFNELNPNIETIISKQEY